MKRNFLICALLLTLPGAMAQTGNLEQVLRSVEAHNREIRANSHLIVSQKLENKTANNLSDPTVSYSYMWASGDESVSELEVAQGFDFPTLYIQRSKLNRLKEQTFDNQAQVVRRDILLQAQEICYDIILLRAKKIILDERLRNAEELSVMYNQRLARGDANILETNKINLELLNVKTETRLNGTALNNKLAELRAINGDEPIEFNDTVYPFILHTDDLEQLKAEVLPFDYGLLAIEKESEAARKQVSVNRSGWIPKLQVGYRRNTESGTPFNGVMMGMSIPLFENKHKVKAAKAQSAGLNYQKENTALLLESQLTQSYQEACVLRGAMEEYEKTFATQSDLTLLKKALVGGEISMIEYFVEVSVVYQSQINYLDLQNQYHKLMAGIYKNRL